MRMSDWSSDVCSSDLRIDSSACAQGSSTGMPAKWASSDISTDGTASSHATQCAVARLTTHSTSDSTAMLIAPKTARRSEEHTSELQSLMRISYAVFCLKKKKTVHK